jgi:hypothetical protein
VGESVLKGDRSDGSLQGICGDERAAGRVEPHGLEVVRDGEVEILPKATLQGPDADAGYAAQVLDANGFIVAMDPAASTLPFALASRST